MSVTGIGGIFFRAKDPIALSAWYEKHLGVNNTNVNYEPWIQQEGPTTFALFPGDTDYFGSETQSFMLNFRVNNLDGMLKQFQQDGVKIIKDVEEQAGVGKFASIEDSEGNRVELWEPVD